MMSLCRYFTFSKILTMKFGFLDQFYYRKTTPPKINIQARPNYIFPRTSLSVKEKLMIKSSGTKGNCQCSTHLINFFI